MCYIIGSVWALCDLTHDVCLDIQDYTLLSPACVAWQPSHLHTCSRAECALPGHPLHGQTNQTLSDVGSSVAVSCFGASCSKTHGQLSQHGSKRRVCLRFKVMKMCSQWRCGGRNSLVLNQKEGKQIFGGFGFLYKNWPWYKRKHIWMFVSQEVVQSLSSKSEGTTAAGKGLKWPLAG